MRIGITERGDAGLDFTWYNKLSKTENNKKFVYQGAVLITKNANPKFQEKVQKLMEQGFHNLIIHFTCTGWGNTPMEPNVPKPEIQLQYMEQMVKNGFPISHCVLRIDPIIPTAEGINRFHQVMNHPFVQAHPDLRIRVSILDRYKYVLERAKNIQTINLGSSSFYPTWNEQKLVRKAISEYPTFQFESCAEKQLCEMNISPVQNIQNTGCISQKDLNIFHLSYSNDTTGIQRKTCLCLSCKEELLNQRHRCPHQCLYCYWKD